MVSKQKIRTFITAEGIIGFQFFKRGRVDNKSNFQTSSPLVIDFFRKIVLSQDGTVTLHYLFYKNIRNPNKNTVN